MSTLTLEQLNTLPLSEAVRLLDGLYEHSPWIVEKALQQRPFVSLAAFKHGMVQVVAAAGRDAQLALLRAHPELAGKAMVDNSLTTESHQRAKQGRPHALHARRVRQNPAASTRTTTRASASPSSLRYAARAALGLSKAEIIATLRAPRARSPGL